MSQRTSRRKFLRQAAATAIAAPLPLRLTAQTRGRRNVVFMLIDDLRYDFLSFMGHPFVETPNMDRVARNGVVFRNAFVTHSLCSPSRATILSGQYPHAHGVLDNSSTWPRAACTSRPFLRRPRRRGYRWVRPNAPGIHVQPKVNNPNDLEQTEVYGRDSFR